MTKPGLALELPPPPTITSEMIESLKLEMKQSQTESAELLRRMQIASAGIDLRIRLD
jgi:hypothetical protein